VPSYLAVDQSVLDLREGSQVIAAIKASEVILATADV